MNIKTVKSLLDRIEAAVKPLLSQGKLAAYIPQLSSIDQMQFGMAFTALDGQEAFVGQADVPFSIQSISKLFALILALDLMGDELWTRVGREPSGRPFNELVQVDYEKGATRNPFVNAGALVVTDILCSRFAQPEIALLQKLQLLAGSDGINVDQTVVRSERETCHRNAAIAHLLKSYGSMHSPVETVLDTYCGQCAIAMTTRQIARCALPLASDEDIHPDRLGGALSPSQRQSVIALMLTCGTYDAAGNLAARIGLPMKSGVGGGIVAVIPGVGAISAWSPGLDASGNSLAAAHALELFSLNTGLSLLKKRERIAAAF